MSTQKNKPLNTQNINSNKPKTHKASKEVLGIKTLCQRHKRQVHKAKISQMH